MKKKRSPYNQLRDGLWPAVIVAMDDTHPSGRTIFRVFPCVIEAMSAEHAQKKSIELAEKLFPEQEYLCKVNDGNYPVVTDINGTYLETGEPDGDFNPEMN